MVVKSYSFQASLEHNKASSQMDGDALDTEPQIMLLQMCLEELQESERSVDEDPSNIDISDSGIDTPKNAWKKAYTHHRQ